IELGTDVLCSRQALDDDHTLRNGGVGRAVRRQVERFELFAHAATTALAPRLLVLTAGASTGGAGTAPGRAGARRAAPAGGPGPVEARGSRTSGANAGTRAARRARTAAGAGGVGGSGGLGARRAR